MISREKFNTACECAFTDACAFADGDYIHSTTGFFSRHPRNVLRAINDLTVFAYDYAKMGAPQQVTHLPRENYASWLMRLGTGEPGIAMLITQMRRWEYNSNDDEHQFCRGVPLPVQKVRSAIHEIGHYRLAPELLDGANPGDFAMSATDVQEEQAWVYAFVFLSILGGDYSLRSRANESDDLPRVFM